MPDRETHNLFNRLILGRDYNEINALLDAPSKWLGPNHRILFHDKTTPLMVTLLTGDPKAGVAAFLHIYLDELQDKLRARRLKRRLRTKRNRALQKLYQAFLLSKLL